MKQKKTLAELRLSCNSRSPVEQTVIRRWNDIIVCIGNGWSLDKIADCLRNEGEYLGNEKNTGFREAVKRVAIREGLDLHGVRSGGAQASTHPQSDQQQRPSMSDIVDPRVTPPGDETREFPAAPPPPPPSPPPLALGDPDEPSDF